MINQEILGGLKSALERGESLKRAMMTFYNSGYKKEEIEEGARMLLEYNRESHPNLPIQEIPKTVPVQQPVTLQKPASQIQRTIPPIQNGRYYPVQAVKYAPVQRVSNYEEGITQREKAIIFVLVFLLIFLIAVLGLIFLFKQEIINFFSTIFSQ